MKRLLLLGGGHAHVHLLKSLAGAPLPDVDVTLVSPYDRQIYSGMLPGWVAGHYALGDCLIPLAPLVNVANIRFVQTAAIRIDPHAASVHCADGSELLYDWLSIDTGTAFDPAAIDGAAEHALLVRPLEQFIAQWQTTRAQLGTGDPVVMVGGGAAGIELLLSMQHTLPHCRFELVSAANTLPGSVGPRLARILKARGITLTLPPRQSEFSRTACCWRMGARFHRPAQSWPSAPPQVSPSQHRDWCATSAASSSRMTSCNPCRIREYSQRATARRWRTTHGPSPASTQYAPGRPCWRIFARRLRVSRSRRTLRKPVSLYLISTGGKHAIGSWGRLSWEGDWVWRWKDRIDREFIKAYALGQPEGT